MVALSPPPPGPQSTLSLGRSPHLPRKFLITSFLEPPLPPGLEVTAAAARDAGLVRPLVCPTSAEKLPFLGVSSAMAAAGKQRAPRPVRPPPPPPPGAARTGCWASPLLSSPLNNSRLRQRRSGPAQPPSDLHPAPALTRPRPYSDPGPDPNPDPEARERGQSASAAVRVELATARGRQSPSPVNSRGPARPGRAGGPKGRE